MANNQERKYTKKTAKARSSWNVVNSDVKDIGKHLKTLYKYLGNIIVDKVPFKNDLSRSENNQEAKGNKARIHKNPTNLGKISFSWLGVDMDVDFKISTSDLLKDSELVGCVIYSATRERINGYKRMKESECVLYSSDKKPFMSIMVDPYGRVTVPGILDEEWWVYDDKVKPPDYYYDELAAEIHYMVREKIWKKALSWSNDGLLP